MSEIATLPKLLSIKAVAEQTGIPKTQLYDAITRGELPRRCLTAAGEKGMTLTAEEVAAWIERKTTPANSPAPPTADVESNDEPVRPAGSPKFQFKHIGKYVDPIIARRRGRRPPKGEDPAGERKP